MATAPQPPRPPGEPPSQIQTRPRAVQITSQQVQPTLRLYMQDEDVMQLAVLSNFNNASVTFNLRFLKPNGEIIPTVKTIIAPTAGVFSVANFIPMGEGFLLSASATLTTALTNGQWIFANATLQRGSPFNSISFDEIFAGYVAGSYSPSWPDWPPQRPTDGAGTPVSFTVPNPAAGQDWSVTVPTSRRWLVLGVRATFTASATVANRNIGLTQNDGAITLFLLRFATAITAGQSFGFNGVPGIQPFADTTGNLTIPIPQPDILETGYKLASSTAGLQAGDQWSGIQLMLMEWAEIQ